MSAFKQTSLLAMLAFSIGAWQPGSAAETYALASGQADRAAFKAGVAIASLIKFELLPGLKIDLEAVESGGAVDNIRRLQDGRAQFAIVPSVVGHAVRAGLGPFAGEAPDHSLRAITTLWHDAVHVVLREEDVSSGTIDDLLLLKRRKIVLSETAYGHAHAHQLMLGQLGLDIDGIFDIAHVSAVDGLTAMKRGDASAFGMTARPPTVVVGQAFSTTSPSLKFLDITEKQRQKINGAHWLWMPYVIPASTYPGQDSDVNTIALANQLIVKAEVDANVVHAITKSLFEHLDYLGRVDSLMADLELSDALTGMAMPLHPGALRYFREAGLISDVPRALVPVDRKAPNRRQEKTGYPDSNVAGSWHESPDGQSTEAGAGGNVPIDVHRDIVAPDGRSTSEPSVAPFLWRVVL